jgi:RNA polymerase sigma-70 factor, ECF subfamily
MSLNPEEQLLTEQHKQRLQAVFRALPEQDRCCLRSRADGPRYREIARMLDISLGAVALTLARSLERLARVGEI